MHKYKIIKPDEDVRQALIRKTGGYVDFTIADIEGNIDYAKREVKSLQDKVGVHQATMKNIERTHPHITTMSLEDLTAAYLYRESMGFVNEAENTINQFNAAIDEDSKGLEEVISALSIDMSCKKKSKKSKKK